MNKIIPSYRGAVDAWECDQMGHMNVQFYMLKASESFGHFQNAFGLSPARITDETHVSPFKTLRIQYKAEIHAGSVAHGLSGVRGLGGNVITGFTHLFETPFDKLSAVYEFTAEYANLETQAPAEIPQDIADNIKALIDDHSDMYKPEPLKSEIMPAKHLDHMYETARSAIDTWECDSFHNIEMQHIVARFSDAATHILAVVGLTREEMRSRNLGSAALDYYSEFHAPLSHSRPIVMKSGLLGAHGKLFGFGHNLINLDTDEIAVTTTVLGCYFDMTSRKSVQLPKEFTDYPKEKLLGNLI